MWLFCIKQRLLYSIGSHDKTMFLEIAHGGHLGFYEGGLVYANPVTWLDRALVGLAGGLLMAHDKCAAKDMVACSEHPSEDEPDLIKSATIVYRDPLDKKPQKACSWIIYLHWIRSVLCVCGVPLNAEPLTLSRLSRAGINMTSQT